MSTDMDRRAVLLGLFSAAAIAAGADLDAQEPSGPPDPSLYIPKAHVVGELKFLHDFMEEYGFVMLVTATPTLRITHIPSVLDRTQGRFGTLRGHISAQNAQKAALDGTHQAVVVFRGPQGYISPTLVHDADVGGAHVELRRRARVGTAAADRRQGKGARPPRHADRPQ